MWKFSGIGAAIKSAIGSILGYGTDTKILKETIKEKMLHSGVSRSLVDKVLNRRVFDNQEQTIDAIKLTLKQELSWADRVNDPMKDRFQAIIMVGINGSGKTSSVVKLANWYCNNGFKTTTIACDLFRAAALEQLKTMCENASINCIFGDSNNPSGMAFSGIERAINDGYNIAIIDTSGRMQGRDDLMQELAKIDRSVDKAFVKTKVNFDKRIFFVLDASTGQVAIDQLKLFSRYIKIEAIIATKIDSVQKAGVILSVLEDCKIPIAFICSGDNINEIEKFSLAEYLEHLFS